MKMMLSGFRVMKIQQTQKTHLLTLTLKILQAQKTHLLTSEHEDVATDSEQTESDGYETDGTR